MRGRFLNARGCSLLAAILAALLLAGGCGGSSDSKDVTVQTGSLSKAEFIAKANAICKAARTKFTVRYSQFIKQHKALTNKAQQEAALREAIESIITPNIEGEITHISQLGAPKAYSAEVASFLNSLQERLEEGQDDPTKLIATPYPFKAAEDIAGKAGLKVCATSFS
jgi:acetylornithine deacetylase/succinyl-diaminopimelate desuccinylase-like protein